MSAPQGSTPFHNSVNQDVLDLMPLDARRVVDVGCMGGDLAAAYRRRNPGAHYTGIEISERYAQVARAHCDEVLVGNIEGLGEEPLAGLCRADLWVFGDVLEHLIDPWGLLRRVRERSATPPGMIVCVPNVQHWSILRRIATGGFRYEDAGLLDRTHLRWFSRLTLVEMFAGMGYEVVEGRSRVHPEPMPAQFARSLVQLALGAGVPPQVLLSDANAYQWVVRAVPAPPPRG